MTRTRTVVLVGLAVAFLLAGFVSGYASSDPDGLERVAIDRGFDDTATDHPLSGSPVADYALRGVDDERIAGGLAGVAGVALTGVVGVALFGGLSALSRRSAHARQPQGADPAPSGG